MVSYYKDKIKVKIICPTHGVFEQRPSAHKNGSGCPKCNESKGEREIRNFLKQHKINYIYNKKFKDCKDQKELPFDFYLQELNTCIEYDGRQHFMSNAFFGGESSTLIIISEREFVKLSAHYFIEKSSPSSLFFFSL